jgi:molybdopterin synthase catalytic subunit
LFAEGVIAMVVESGRVATRRIVDNVSTSASAVAKGGAVRRCRLTTEPLDAAAILASVADRAAGGQTLFVGAVRDHDPQGGDRPVTGLDYEAHPDAAAFLQRVAEQVAQIPGVVAVSAEHRLGMLTVGEAAVVVAVSAAHRHEAFVACRALIDTLKNEVPIWKRQWYADGTNDWVGCA